jgi:hypothetical protein
MIKYTSLWLNVCDLYLAKAIEALLLSQVRAMEDQANDTKEFISILFRTYERELTDRI